MQRVTTIQRNRVRAIRAALRPGSTQAEFAAWIGIPFKRWNHYERGYPISRGSVAALFEKTGGIALGNWLAFGQVGDLPMWLRTAIREYDKTL